MRVCSSPSLDVFVLRGIVLCCVVLEIEGICRCEVGNKLEG